MSELYHGLPDPGGGVVLVQIGQVKPTDGSDSSRPTKRQHSLALRRPNSCHIRPVTRIRCRLARYNSRRLRVKNRQEVLSRVSKEPSHNINKPRIRIRYRCVTFQTRIVARQRRR